MSTTNLSPMNRLHDAVDRILNQPTVSTDVLADVADEIRERIAMLPSSGRAFTMRAWFEAHTGDQVNTFQVGFGGRPWMPSDRAVDTTRATYALLSGSRRDYAGLRVVLSGPDAILVDGGSDEDGSRETILYTVA